MDVFADIAGWIAAQPNATQIVLLMIACVMIGLSCGPLVKVFMRKWLGIKSNGSPSHSHPSPSPPTPPLPPTASSGIHEKRRDDPRWESNAAEHAALGEKVDELRRDMDNNFGKTHERIDKIFSLLAKSGDQK